LQLRENHRSSLQLKCLPLSLGVSRSSWRRNGRQE
jgi:hypothetical protein